VFRPDPTAYPFTPKTFRQPHGFHQSFVDEGAGDPVLLLHGNPTWSAYFRRVIPTLTSGYRCIAPDHIGCGLSSRPALHEYDFQLKTRIDDLERLLNHLGISKNLTLVVHDWGGMIGLGLAARHPGLLKRLVASNTGCTGLPRGKRLPFTLRLGRNSKLGEWMILQRNSFCKFALKWCVKRKPLDAQAKALYLGPYDTPHNRLAVAKFVQTIPLQDSEAGFEIVKQVEASLPGYANVPTLLLWGLKDFVFDKHFLAAWQKNFPHAVTHAWADCGHYLFDDCPEDCIPRIRPFLNANPL
jgi:haloalkane dehalogenase